VHRFGGEADRALRIFEGQAVLVSHASGREKKRDTEKHIERGAGGLEAPRHKPRKNVQYKSRGLNKAMKNIWLDRRKNQMLREERAWELSK